MKLKEGDSVLCKKTLGKHFIKGDYYDVVSSSNDIMYIRNEYSGIFGFGIIGEVFFNVEPRGNSDFNNYFYTKKELRKLKLNKIEELYDEGK